MRSIRNLFLCLVILLFFLLLSAVSYAENPGVVEIDNPAIYTRLAAISDVHGEYDHVRRLLRSAGITDASDHWIGQKTLLIVAGDSIDKGPMSLAVLRLWMQLQAEAPRTGGRVLVLLGNHEAEFLAKPNGKKSVIFRTEAESHNVPVAALAGGTNPEGHFLREMPLAARIGKWLFCHSGWIPQMPWRQFVTKAHTMLAQGDYANDLLLADDSILEKKDGADGEKWYKSPNEISALEGRLAGDGLYGVVFGHQPNAFDIKDNVGEYSDGRIFKIDSGMAPNDKDNNPGYAGHLLLFTKPMELSQGKRPANAFSIAADGSKVKL